MTHEGILKYQLAKRWLDPVARAEDIFKVRTSRGDLIPYVAPPSHAQLLREGPLGEAKKLIDEGYVYQSVLNKGRQLGFSTVTAIETVLIAEEYPNTTLYYIADDKDQTKDFLDKVEQLCRTANHYPDELGGGPILKVQELEQTFTKKVNDTTITGLSGRAKGGKRGKNSPYVVWDEMAWCISVNNEQELIWDIIQYYVRQGGCIRAQSTPRSTDDKFWKWLDKPKEYGIKAYTFPTIENWKSLDLKQPLYIDLDNERRRLRQWKIFEQKEINELIKIYSNNHRFEIDLKNKEIRQKNIIINYPWVKLAEVEKSRNIDYEKFLQENLCTPVDEKYKVIPSEWIYRNITQEPEQERRSSQNPYYMLIDVAQKHDITAISIVEKLSGDIIVERKLDKTQEKYDIQTERIWGWFNAFKPQAMSIDNTGHGIVLGDFLEKKLRIANLPLSLLHRVDFTNPSKEVMATGFRSLVQADRYKFLNETALHRESIRHVERVEKEDLETCTKYSGKRWGRDDFFWSKAQIVYFTNLLMPSPTAAFSKIKSDVLSLAKQPMGRLTEYEKQKKKLEKPKTQKEISAIISIARAIRDLNVGAVFCKDGKKYTPLYCTKCKDVNCMEYDYMRAVCESYGVTPEILWKKQKTYSKEGENGRTKDS